MTAAVAPQAIEGPPAHALAVGGACLLNLTLSSGLVEVLPAQPTWGVGGSGLCAVPGHGLLTGSLGGSITGVETTSAGCAVGVYRGNLSFAVSPAVDQVDSTVVSAVMAGASLQVTMAVATPTVFAGTGTFAETSTDATVACPLAGNTSTTWKGVFEFGTVDTDTTGATADSDSSK
ncbi:MAG TPA: hypothetical protein VHF47_00870 [Acidimicrobiales bacterium]|nr:hypothetical protein [Acidimicrobiales bacterium]